MIYKLERVNRTIDKIIRDLGIGQDEIPYADFIEWIADGLEHIGSYYQFVEKTETIIVQDYQALLPCDTHKVKRIMQGCEYTDYSSSFERTLDNLKANRFDEFNLVEQKLNYNGSLIGPYSSRAFSSTDYNVNLNTITTSFKTGVIEIQYLAFPVDEKGWPLIPENVSFRDALFWKCAYHLSMRCPQKMPNPRLQDMEYCKRKWDFYCTQARGEANMPDPQMQERFANNWLRLFNPVDEHSDYYRNIGKPQGLNLNGGI